jgi:hypothetical protein
MRTIRVLGCLAALLAVSAVTAASAAASPEFDSSAYPAEVKSKEGTVQAFNGGGVIIACAHLTTATNEEIGKVKPAEATNPTKNSATLVVHPIYTECFGTIGTGSFPVEVKTTGCNYKVHAVAPNKKEGSVDVICETGKEIENVFIGLTGCVVSVPGESGGLKRNQGLKNLEYKNEPKAGTAEQETIVGSEVSKIKSHATSSCGLVIGTAEFEAEYRAGKITEPAPGVKGAELLPPGNPATSVTKDFEAGGAKAQIAGEVGINEAHWYENHVLLAKQSGGPGEEGEPTLSWGKLTLSSTGTGAVECLTEWGGHVFNPEGGGPPPGGGMAAAGETHVEAFHAYGCTATECETTLKSKLEATGEGLGITVEGGVAKAGAWESKLTGAAPVRLKIGNKTSGSPKQIKWHLKCPKTTGGEYDKVWSGELSPELEAGTAIGSAPSKLTFNSGELEVGAEKGTVAGKLKMMGYEGGEIVTTKNP